MANPYSQLEDEKLMLLYQNDDHLAFEVIYQRHKSRVYEYLNKRLHDKQYIEDLFQLVFVKFHRSRHLYDAKHPLLKWIYTITRSEFLDFIKKKKIETVELNDETISIDEAEIEVPFDIENEKSLSDNERKAIQLKYYSDKDYDEISKILKTSQSNSRKLISRGIKKLKLKFAGRNSNEA